MRSALRGARTCPSGPISHGVQTRFDHAWTAQEVAHPGSKDPQIATLSSKRGESAVIAITSSRDQKTGGNGNPGLIDGLPGSGHSMNGGWM